MSAISETSRPGRAVATAARALLVLAAVRVLVVVLHEPLAGYANQFDMMRTSACIGLWPDRPEDVRTWAHRPAPFARYVRGATLPAWCDPGTEVVLAGFVEGVDRFAAVLGLGDAAGLDLRVFGFFNALLLLATMFAFDRGLRPVPGARLAHAAIAASVLADPFDTLYLNTLYTEFAALWGAYLVLGALAVLTLVARPPRWPWFVLVVGLGALGASRLAHAMLPTLLVALAALSVRDRSSGRRAALAAGAVVAVGVLVFQVGTETSKARFAQLHRTDMLFGALLPASADPVGLVEGLGLPPECATLIHVSWFLMRGRDPVAECPQAYELSLARIGLVVLAEPGTVALALARGLVVSTNWRLPYVGELAGGSYARLPTGPAGLTASLVGPLSRAGLAGQLALWLVPFGAGVLALVRLVLRRPGRLEQRGDAMLAGCAILIGLGWVGSVFGDGYSELARHLHLAANASLVGWVVLLALLVGNLRRRDGGGSPACAALGAGLALLAWAYLHTQPLAVGLVELPAGPTVAPGPIRVSGWAVDPTPITRVEAVSGAGSRLPLAWTASPRIDAFFPIAGESAGREFSGEIDVVAIAAGDTPLAIVVTNAKGIETTIDRRWLRPAEPEHAPR